MQKAVIFPSTAELFYVTKVKDTVDAASKLCGGNKIGTAGYWTSSQTESTVNYVGYIKFKYGIVQSYPKDSNYLNVCCIRAFN